MVRDRREWRETVLGAKVRSGLGERRGEKERRRRREKKFVYVHSVVLQINKDYFSIIIPIFYKFLANNVKLVIYNSIVVE
jgi:hypothetical protein